MRLTKFFKIIGIVTTLSLVYIHLQMQIIDLAYQGKSKEQKIRQLIEQNGNVTYSIFTQKSANNLGIKMLAENSDMHFVDSNNIVPISTSEEFLDNELLSQQVEPQAKSNSLLSLLSFGSQAEARQQP